MYGLLFLIFCLILNAYAFSLTEYLTTSPHNIYAANEIVRNVYGRDEYNTNVLVSINTTGFAKTMIWYIVPYL